MAFPTKIPPATDRSGPSFTRANYRSPQPYLIPTQRRSFVASTLPLFPHESEDACLTGSTRSLYRRVLGLNVLTDATRIELVNVSSISKIA
jgi:hypothetical protein